VLVIIACTLIVIADNTDYFSGSVYVRGGYIDVDNFPSSISVDNLYEISR
jgi:transcriptional regulator of nitric oxide reductase